MKRMERVQGRLGAAGRHQDAQIVYGGIDVRQGVEVRAGERLARRDLRCDGEAPVRLVYDPIEDKTGHSFKVRQPSHMGRLGRDLAQAGMGRLPQPQRPGSGPLLGRSHLALTLNGKFSKGQPSPEAFRRARYAILIRYPDVRVTVFGPIIGETHGARRVVPGLLPWRLS